MSAGRVSFIGELDVARFPHIETIVVVEGELSLTAAGAAPLVLGAAGEAPSSDAARHFASRLQRAARFVFCAAACEWPNQRGITPLRADANFKPSNRCRPRRCWAPPRNAAATTSSPTTARSTSRAPGIRHPTTASSAPHRLNEFMYPAGRRRAVRSP